MRHTAALLALCLACGPYRVVPTVGSTPTVYGCFTTEQGVTFYRDEASRCPDERSATERVRVVEERYGVSLSGARVYVVDAFVECGRHGDRYGCTLGLSSTVTGGPLVLRSVAHELSHQAIDRKPGGPFPIQHLDLDSPPHKRGAFSETLLD